MMMPKKVKFRKQQRGRRRGLATRGQRISLGDFGLQALEAGWVTARQIEAARIAMTRHVKRGGKIWIRIFPDKPVTKKPLETRMGKGKGAPEEWVCVIKPARIIYEMEGVTREVAMEAFRLAAHKLPIKTRFISRAMLEGGAESSRTTHPSFARRASTSFRPASASCRSSCSSWAFSAPPAAWRTRRRCARCAARSHALRHC